MKVRRIDFWPDEWLAGTAQLPWADIGVYITACALIYSIGGPIRQGVLYAHCRPDAEDDPHRNAARSFRKSFQRLLRMGKLYLTSDGLISQKRCEAELRKSTQRIERAAGARASREVSASSLRHQRVTSASLPRHVSDEKDSNINGHAVLVRNATSNYQLSKKERGEISNFKKVGSLCSPSARLKERKRDLLLQKLIRFANATMGSDTANSAIAGLMAEDADEAKRWFELLDGQMRQCGWNDH